MNSLLESPWPVVGFGGLTLLLLAVAFVNTRRGALLVAMGGVALLVLLGVVVEWLVVTPREEVKNTLYAAAEAMEQGDESRLMGLIDPQSTKFRETVRYYLSIVEVRKASVRSPQVRIHPGGRAATVELTGRASLASKSGVRLTREEIALLLEVKLHKQDGRWLLRSYRNIGIGSSN